MRICRHFGTCGGCTYQDYSPDDYRALKRGMILRAFERHGFSDPDVGDVIAVAPGTRRRAVFKIAKRASAVQIGFHAAKSHQIVDMHECLVITPAMFALVGGLREMMAGILHDGEDAEAHVTEADNGFDVSLRWPRKLDPTIAAEVARWMRKLNLARVSANNDVLSEMEQPQIRIGMADVRIPLNCFLQPTKQGEGVLQSFVFETFQKAKNAADLFCGVGTFTLPLAERARVHAVDSDKAMLDALASAVRNTSGLKPVTTEKRDLSKQPLLADELKSFDSVVLDPPRAGAQAQAVQLAQSKVRRIAYVSCNADTFARDARILADGGYKMETVVPVDQFLWSEHIELVGSFAR